MPFNSRARRRGKIIRFAVVHVAHFVLLLLLSTNHNLLCGISPICNDVINENKQRMSKKITNAEKEYAWKKVCENDVCLLFLLEGYCRINFMLNRADKIEPNGMGEVRQFIQSIFMTRVICFWFVLLLFSTGRILIPNLRDFDLMGTYSHGKGGDLLLMLYIYL